MDKTCLAVKLSKLSLSYSHPVCHLPNCKNQTIAQVPPIRVPSKSRVIWSESQASPKFFSVVGKSSRVESQVLSCQVESSHRFCKVKSSHRLWQVKSLTFVPQSTQKGLRFFILKIQTLCSQGQHKKPHQTSLPGLMQHKAGHLPIRYCMSDYLDLGRGERLH